MYCPTSKSRLNNSRNGISLVEAVIALMILGIIGAALTGLMLRITAATNSAKFKSEATNYAQQAIEQAKDAKNQNWANLVSGCYTDGTMGTSIGGGDLTHDPCMSGSQIGTTPYRRLVFVTINSSQAKVQSVVKWREKNIAKSVEIDTFFYQY